MSPHLPSSCFFFLCFFFHHSIVLREWSDKRRRFTDRKVSKDLEKLGTVISLFFLRKFQQILGIFLKLDNYRVWIKSRLFVLIRILILCLFNNEDVTCKKIILECANLCILWSQDWRDKNWDVRKYGMSKVIHRDKVLFKNWWDWFGGGMGRVKLKEYVRRYVANWKLKLHFSVKGCQILGYIYVEILKER